MRQRTEDASLNFIFEYVVLCQHYKKFSMEDPWNQSQSLQPTSTNQGGLRPYRGAGVTFKYMKFRQRPKKDPIL